MMALPSICSGVNSSWKRHNANRAIRWYTEEKRRSSCIVNGSFHSRGSELLATTPPLASTMITVVQVDRVTICICSDESALFICDLRLDTRLFTVCLCAQLLASPLFIFSLFWKARIFCWQLGTLMSDHQGHAMGLMGIEYCFYYLYFFMILSEHYAVICDITKGSDAARVIHVFAIHSMTDLQPLCFSHVPDVWTSSVGRAETKNQMVVNN